MHKTHPCFELPSPSTTIWRYVDLAKLLALFESNALYFSAVRALADQDRWEAVIPNRWVRAWSERLKAEGITELHVASFAKALSDGREVLFRTCFVNCWHMNAYESDAMWKLYANGRETIAIRSTVGKLCRAVEAAEQEVHVGRVTYLDHDSYEFNVFADNSNLNIMVPLLWKLPSYTHEQELRAVVFSKDRDGRRVPGVTVAVDLNELVAGVYVSPRSPEWFRVLLQGILRRYGYPDIAIHQSAMDLDPPESG